jgi:rhodanese-related sulfurtransferase
MNMKRHLTQLAAACTLALPALLPALAQAQQATPRPAAQEWKHQVRQLTRAEVDALLAHPDNLTVLDVRRPDELVSKGGFPAYLNIQSADIEKQLAYIPRERQILTVSNHAHRAGAVGDLLLSKGYKVAGAAGSEDYEQQGGTVTRIRPPAPKVAARD